MAEAMTSCLENTVDIDNAEELMDRYEEDVLWPLVEFAREHPDQEDEMGKAGKQERRQ